MKHAMIHAGMRRQVCRALGLGALALAMPATAMAKDYTLVINNMSYGKAPSGLQVGDTVTWVNKDSVPHTVTARDKSFNLAVDRGASVTLTLTKAGTVTYYCLYHPMMRGTLNTAAK